MKPWMPLLGVCFLAVGAGGEGCQPLNCPYPAEEAGRNIYYAAYTEDPKDLDPAVSYNANEYVFLGQIYESPLQYHYLKRPFTLEPLTLAQMPKARLLDRAGKELPADAPDEQVDRVVYDLHLKPGIRYQDHPCFAKTAGGKPRYVPVDPALAGRVWSPEDFPEKATRELTADDYVLAIRRMADPKVPCPIRETLAKYLVGMEESTEAMTQALTAERARRKAAAGTAYNQVLDEKENPVILDPEAYPFPGAEVVDRLTFRIAMKKRYPQILYWLAMPFFSPVPREALDFYAQPALADHNITLNSFPVGTGPYYLQRFDRNRQIVLARNPNYHEDRYPTEGTEEDRAGGLLADAGKRLPFLDKVVFTLDKEPTSVWNKFLQGYYDAAGIPADSFERAVAISIQGSPEVSGELKDKGILLHREAALSTSYIAVNMRDPLVGGVDEAHCKLRQAIGIAIDGEERIQIFLNGRGIPAQGVLPPGIFGHEEGPEAMNAFVYDWDAQAAAPKRKPLAEAKRLLAEAGYPGGIGPDGKQLVIGFDHAMTNSADQQYLDWLVDRLKLLGIHLESRQTDYNRFQEKAHSGNLQMFQWGWNADYPDPENFLFLFYGPNARAGKDGENAANYANPEYDALFHKVENMENSPERLVMIRKLRTMLQHDAPWMNAFHPVTFTLDHAWLRNHKSIQVANNNLKYLSIDAAERVRRRRAWNQAVWWPLWAVLGAGLALLVPSWMAARRRERQGAR